MRYEVKLKKEKFLNCIKAKKFFLTILGSILIKNHVIFSGRAEQNQSMIQLMVAFHTGMLQYPSFLYTS